MHCSTDNDERGEEAGILRIEHVAIISGESTLSASASSLTLNLAILKIIFLDVPKITSVYFLDMSIDIRIYINKKSHDNDMKFTLHIIVSYAAMRMESKFDANIIRCIFQEYR